MPTADRDEEMSDAELHPPIDDAELHPPIDDELLETVWSSVVEAGMGFTIGLTLDRIAR